MPITMCSFIIHLPRSIAHNSDCHFGGKNPAHKEGSPTVAATSNPCRAFTYMLQAFLSNLFRRLNRWREKTGLLWFGIRIIRVC
jgi:hypothetical protein